MSRSYYLSRAKVVGKKTARAPIYIVLLSVAIFIAVAAYFISDIDSKDNLIVVDQDLVESSPQIIIEEESEVTPSTQETHEQRNSQNSNTTDALSAGNPEAQN